MELRGLGLKIRRGSAERREPEIFALARIASLPPRPACMDALERVPLEMTCADRRRVRRRLVAPDGLELGLALPTGTVLEPGAVLYLNRVRVYVVQAALEEVVVIQPRDALEGFKVAHAIGNLHRDICPQEDGIVALWDGALELLLNRLKVNFSREHRAFLGRPNWEH